MMKVAVLVGVILVAVTSIKPSPTHEIIEYYPDGTLMNVRTVDEEGRDHGHRIDYYADGQIYADAVYDHGSWVTITTYDNLGRLTRHDYHVYQYIGNEKTVVKILRH